MPLPPLRANDPGEVLKTKIRDQISDVQQHLLAMRTAMAESGESFACDSGNPKSYTRSKWSSMASTNSTTTPRS